MVAAGMAAATAGPAVTDLSTSDPNTQVTGTCDCGVCVFMCMFKVCKTAKGSQEYDVKRCVLVSIQCHSMCVHACVVYTVYM